MSNADCRLPRLALEGHRERGRVSIAFENGEPAAYLLGTALVQHFIDHLPGATRLSFHAEFDVVDERIEGEGEDGDEDDVPHAEFDHSAGVDVVRCVESGERVDLVGVAD